MVRSVSVDINGIRRGAWSEEEDQKLRDYVQRYGHWNWRLLPKYAGLARCGKSCRLRWLNYLKPGVKRGNFSKQEEDLIVELHAQMGNKWSAIAADLPGRTDNDVKNFWHTRIDKRCSKQNFTRKIKGRTNEACLEHKPAEITPLIGSSQSDLTSPLNTLKDLKRSEISFDTYPSDQPTAELQVFDFWRDPFVADTTDYYTKGYETQVHNEFSSSNCSYLSALHWTLEYDAITTDHSVDRDFPGNF